MQADVQALVNPVNCVGIMGKGLALEFKQRFPKNFSLYREACSRGNVKPGSLFIVEECDRYIINFPTKRHWRDKSLLWDIEMGLEALARDIQAWGIKSIAIPALGCGNGGLDWEVVKPMIVVAIAPLDIRAIIYEPSQDE